MGYLLFWCSMAEENKITFYGLSFALPVFFFFILMLFTYMVLRLLS